MGLLGKIKTLAGKNASTITKAVDKAGDVVDKKTKGKHHDKIEKAEGAATKALGNLAGPARSSEPTGAGGAAPTADSDGVPGPSPSK